MCDFMLLNCPIPLHPEKLKKQHFRTFGAKNGYFEVKTGKIVHFEHFLSILREGKNLLFYAFFKNLRGAEGVFF